MTRAIFVAEALHLRDFTAVAYAPFRSVNNPPILVPIKMLFCGYVVGGSPIFHCRMGLQSSQCHLLKNEVFESSQRTQQLVGTNVLCVQTHSKIIRNLGTIDRVSLSWCSIGFSSSRRELIHSLRCLASFRRSTIKVWMDAHHLFASGAKLLKSLGID